jgi:uncharacterized membrane protein YeaQ/YmgE (transglycosylase-associated protein family)
MFRLPSAGNHDRKGTGITVDPGKEDTHMGWVFVIIAGIIIGLLGKFIAPGTRDNTPLWLTILCGIVGVLIGYGWLGGTSGFDWQAFIVSVLIAAVLVVIASTVTGRNTSKKKII